MKQINKILFFCLVCILFACDNEMITKQRDMGFLRLEVETLSNGVTKSIVPENYRSEQLRIDIINEAGIVVKSVDNYQDWIGKQIELKSGVYTIVASSNGFDGQASGENLAYYVGSKKVTVEAGGEVVADIVCTLANVKVTVNFEESIFDKFSKVLFEVSSGIQGIGKQYFSKNRTVFFPVGDLNIRISVKNKAGKDFTMEQKITSVKARNHYILNCKLEDAGSGNIKVEADDAVKEYIYTLTVPVQATTQLQTKPVNAWSRFAYFEGVVAAQTSPLEAANMKFEYKKRTDEVWTVVDAILESDVYKAKISGLTPNTEYTCRFAYLGTETYRGEMLDFKTETENKIPNLSFDDWTKDSKGNIYAATSFETKFWDSGNEGANMISEVNPTKSETKDVKKGKAARLSSSAVLGNFAAASLFTGDFGKATLSPVGAVLNFGQPFNERPSRLKGWYKYNPGKIDYTKLSNIASNSRDACSIYIVLTDWKAPFAVNTGNKQFFNPEDPAIIAYGELSQDKVSPESMSEYQEFTIDLKYRDLKRKPTHILIVCSSSKYGDFFTGSSKSVMLIDEFDLIYGDPVLDTNYMK